jgi:hypothetical protein
MKLRLFCKIAKSKTRREDYVKNNSRRMIYLVVLDGEQYETPFRFFEKRLFACGVVRR